MTPSVVLVGCGKMGRALLGGWFSCGMAPADVVVVDPAAEDLPPGTVRVSSPEELPSDLAPAAVVFAVKPQQLAGVAASCARFAAGGAVFVSVAAGKTIAFCQDALGESAAVVRAMPNTPVEVGRGMIVLCAAPNVGAFQKSRCQTLLQGGGALAWIEDETLMDAVTAISGCGPAYLFHMVEALTEAGTALGLPAPLAETLARQTVIGAGALLAERPEDDAAALRRSVSSPGGSTEAALTRLADPDAGLVSLMLATAKVAAAKSRALAS